jgi:hypothetical protein
MERKREKNCKEATWSTVTWHDSTDVMASFVIKVQG